MQATILTLSLCSLYGCDHFIMFFFTADCTQVTVSESSPDGHSGSTSVTTSIAGLTPVYPGANSVVFYIWSLNRPSLSMDISTRNLHRVDRWQDCATNQNRFQTARLTATAQFSSGSQRFSADVYPLIANHVS